MRSILALLVCLPWIVLAEAKVVITGTIDGVAEGTVELAIDKSFLGEHEQIQQARIKNGKFEISFELDQHRIATFSHQTNTIQLFLEPGDKIDINLADSTVNFTGTGAINNQFLLDFNNQFSADYDEAGLMETINASAIDEYEMKIFDNRQTQMTYYTEYPEAASFTNLFRSYIEGHIQYQYYQALLKYPLLKPGDEEQLTVNSLPNIMIEDMSKKAPLMNRDAVISSAYRGYLHNYIAYHAGRSNNFEKFEDHGIFLEKKYNYALRYLSGEIFTYYLAKELYEFCGKATPAAVQKVYTALTDSDVDGRYGELIGSRCEEPLKAKIPKPKKEKVKTEKVKEPQSPKYDFKMVGLSGKDVSIDDFRGKVIYVDFWASWCGPCRQQFPHAKELKNMLTKDQQKHVVFLYISIDNTEDRWKGAIEKYELEGEHAFSPGGWGSGAASYFKVTSIPRYMLIDKKGNIADPNAKRPSSREAILNDILMLL